VAVATMKSVGGKAGYRDANPAGKPDSSVELNGSDLRHSIWPSSIKVTKGSSSKRLLNWFRGETMPRP